MRVVFSSNIPVTRVAVFAEMAWMECRPELGLLCRAARDNGHRITVATVQSALPGLPDAGAKNVIRWCEKLGLCDRGGGLTALGEDVAERDEAPVPEQGVYDLWLAQHPLIGRRVLAVERLASNRDARFESIERLVFQPDCDKVFSSVLDSKERFLVRDLPAHQGEPGGLVRDTRATCRLRWTLDFDQAHDQWQLDGTLEEPRGNGKHGMRSMQHEPESDGLDLWKLVSSWATGPLSAFGRWNADERRLALPFQALQGPEIDSFHKTLALRRVEIPGKGAYDNVSLEDVAVGPAGAEDAQQWALSRLDRYLAGRPAFRSRTEMRELFAELTEGTPLEPFSPTLPPHDELLVRFRKDPDRFWSMAAPVDLAPYPVGEEELGMFRIGSQAETTADDTANVVRVPYRGGWSMRQLVNRLLAGAVPRKILLCDRYVRGDANLASLKLLVEAFRASVPGVAFDVWTGDEDADFKKIRGITDSAPRSYRDVFGRSVPHDRYLILLSNQGHDGGWQLSNSPLHARVDVQDADPETPLRWKELLGTRLAADQLLPELRQWLKGAER
jgi:hypothetical protein